METLKFCINCEYLISNDGVLNCQHERNKDTSLIDGNVIYKRTLRELRYQINFNNSCGVVGLWWKSKEQNCPF